MAARMQGYGWCGLYRSFSSSSCTKNYDMRAPPTPFTSVRRSRRVVARLSQACAQLCATTLSVDGSTRVTDDDRRVFSLLQIRFLLQNLLHTCSSGPVLSACRAAACRAAEPPAARPASAAAARVGVVVE